MTSPRPSFDLAGLSDALGGPHTLVRELTGGMSRVFVLRDESLGRLIVCKLMDATVASALSADRFAREIRLAATLQHPQIVPLLRAGDLHGVPWFTMPFVEGASVREMLHEEGRVPWRAALPILRDVARALAYAHARDVVHRDIKPENVLITSDSAVVADFGVAKALDRSRTHGGDAATPGVTGFGMVVGTPAYMAPEQAAGDPNTGPAADVYAWGLLAYEMLSGNGPFTASTAQEFFVAHMSRNPEPLPSVAPDVPADLAQLVMQCLEKEPVARPTASDIVQRCEQPLAPGGTVRSAAASRTRAWHRVAIAAVLLLLAGLAGVWQWSRRATAQAAGLAVKERVYFAPFANRTGDPALDGIGEITADYLARSLIESGLADAVGAFGQETAPDARSLKGVLRRGLGGERSEAVSLGAGTLVEGAVYRLGDSLRFEARVIDAREGKLLRSIDPVRAPLASPDAVLGVVADRVLGAIGPYIDPDLRVLAGHTRRPPTFEAYRAFMTGVRIPGWDSTAYYHLLAARLDTTFDYSLVRAARARYHAFHCDGVDSIATVLVPRRTRMMPFEVASLDLYVALCGGNKSAAFEAARRMEAVAPRSDYVQMEVIRAAAATGAHEDVVRRAEQIDGTRGWFAATESASSHLFVTVLPAYLVLGRMADLQQLAMRWPNRLPRQRIAVVRVLLTAAVLEGDCAALGEATARFKAMPSIERADVLATDGWLAAGGASVAGCGKEGQILAEETIRLAPDIERLVPTALDSAMVRIGSANALALLGRTTEARRALAPMTGAWLDALPVRNRYVAITWLVQAAGLSRDTALVTALHRRYVALPPDSSAVNRALTRAFMENALGNTDAASDALLEAIQLDEARTGRLDAFVPLTVEFRYMPGFDAVRADPRVAHALGLRPADAAPPQGAVAPPTP